MFLFALACANPPVASTDSSPTAPAHDTITPCVARTWFPDLDGDGYGGSQGVSACDRPTGHVLNGLDCDDENAFVSPGSLEECDGIDNDCSGQVDGDDAYGADWWWPDDDGDGYGATGLGELRCPPDEGWVAVEGDCDDQTAGVGPGIVEVLDGIDQDCDGVPDDGLPFGSGQDGPLVITADQELPGFLCQAVTWMDGEGIQVADASGFVSGDRLLLIEHQARMGDADTVGEFDWLTVATAGDGLVVPTEPPTNLLGVAADAHRLALYRVPQLTTLTLAEGATLSGPAWDGGCGGLLVVLASESIDSDGVIDMSGKGFAGGEVNVTWESTGQSGESWSGLGSPGNAANGGGGGGGGIEAATCADCESAGGGGGFGTDAADGSRSDPAWGDGGQGGIEYGNVTLDQLHLGSGGGAGALDIDTEGGVGGAGGAGGGAVFLVAPMQSLEQVRVDGDDGQVACSGTDTWCLGGDDSEAGSGGGGSGGTLWLVAEALEVGSIWAIGGQGGPGSVAVGGAGAVGRVRVQAGTVAGFDVRSESGQDVLNQACVPEPGRVDSSAD